jgi:multidrug efflux pump subunit AcrA (membrane-fusion protein)
MKNRIALGSLLAVDNQIDSATGTVRLKAVYDNRDDALYSNQFVNARLLVDTLRGTVLIPTVAIQRGPQSTYVYVVRKDGTVDMRNVDLVSALGGGWSASDLPTGFEILSGHGAAPGNRPQPGRIPGDSP